MYKVKCIGVAIFALLLCISGALYAQDYGVSGVRDIDNILPLKERAELYNEILEWRLDNILPELMRREGIEMWLVICTESNEDPVYLTLVPEPHMFGRRLSILIFHDRGEAGVERLTASYYGVGSSIRHEGTGKWYKSILPEEFRSTPFSEREKDQFDYLAEFIRERNPKNIGINYSEHWDYYDHYSQGDGITAFLKDKLERVLDQKYVDRLVSAEYLCVGWFETRSPKELSVYRHVCGVAHDLIAEAFSNIPLCTLLKARPTRIMTVK